MKTLREDVPTVEEGQETGFTRYQLRNRNRRARRRALKVRVKCKAKAEAKLEATILPRELACINCKTSENHIKCEVDFRRTCNGFSPREATDPRHETRKIDNTHIKCEINLRGKSACEEVFPCKTTELNYETSKIARTHIKREDKPACDKNSPCEAIKLK